MATAAGSAVSATRKNVFIERCSEGAAEAGGIAEWRRGRCAHCLSALVSIFISKINDYKSFDSMTV